MPGFVATAPGVQTDAGPEQMHMNGHKCPGPDGLDQEAAARDADAVHADDGSTAATGQKKEQKNRNTNASEQTKGSHARACSRQSRIETDRTPHHAHFEDNANPTNVSANCIVLLASLWLRVCGVLVFALFLSDTINKDVWFGISSILLM